MSTKLLLTIYLLLFAFWSYGQSCNINANVNTFASLNIDGNGKGQTFTPCSSGKLKSITLWNNLAGNYYFQIREGSTIVATTTHQSTQANRWVATDVSSYNITITAGQTYTFFLLGYSNIRVSNGQHNYYPGGHMIGYGNANTDIDFKIEINVAPTFTAYSPANGATDVPRLAQNFALKFNTASLASGTGDILVNDGATTIATIPAASLSFSGDSANFSIPSVLPQNAILDIIVPNGAVKGSNGLAVTGFSTWSVTTSNDPVPMAVLDVTPYSGKVNVASSDNIIINFTHAVLAASITGKIFVYGDQTGNISGVVTGEGTNQLTFNPDNDFKPNETITVTVLDGIQSSSGQNSINNYKSHFTVASGVSGAYFIESDVVTGIDDVREIDAADIDGDGDIDVATVAITSNRVDWQENNGDGTFTNHSIDASFTRAHTVKITDLDSDGDMDIVVGAHNGGKELAWFENLGNGSFSTKHTISTHVNAMYKVEAADIDSDGDIDLMTAQNDGSNAPYIRIYYNDGSQTFSASTVSTGQTRNIYTTVADMDQDGKMDILYASDVLGSTYRQIGYLKNNGGSFSKVNIANENKQMFALTPSDIDNDGDIDVLCAAHAAGELILYKNESGVFTKEVIANNLNSVYAVKTGDVDGDNDIDVFASSYNQNKVFLFENDGNNNFTQKQIGGTLAGPRSIALADMNNDGDLDVLAAGLSADKIILLDNQTNTPPTVVTPLADVNVNEGSGSQEIILNINDIFSDAENHTITYSVSSSDPDVVASFNASTLNVLATDDFYGTATITVSANDGHDTTDENFDFIVAPINDQPRLTLSHNEVSFVKGTNSSQSITSSVSQPANESGQTLTYTISPDPSTINFANITFDTNTGQVDFATIADNTGIQEFEIIVNDGEAENNLDTAFLTLQVNEGLLGFWPFNEDAHDKSGNGMHMTVQSATLTQDRFGIDNFAYDLGDGRRLVANVNSLGKLAETDMMTVSMWIKPDADLNASSPQQVLMEYAGVFTSYYQAGKLVFRVRDDSNNDNHYEYTVDITGNTWHHIAFTVPTSGNVAFHLNNSRIDISAASGTIKNVASQLLIFASGNSGVPILEFEGNIDDYKIYNRNLTDAEIGDLFNETAPLHLQSISPVTGTELVARNANISFGFSESMSLTAISNNLKVRGNYSGNIEGVISGEATNNIVFNPNVDFKPNELITVSFSGEVVSTDGDTKSISKQLQFKVATEANNPIFLETNLVSGYTDPRKLFPADIDNDGDIDLVAAAINGNNIAWFENNGNAVFTTRIIDSNFTRAHTAEAIDLDSDGDLDIIAASHNSLQEVVWYENQGDGSFGSKIVLSNHTKGIYKIHAADIDNDGDMDLMTAQSDPGETQSFYVTVYANDGNQNFSIANYTSGSFMLSYVSTADIDKDGKMDIIASSINSVSHLPMTWMKNNNNAGNYTAQAFGVSNQRFYGFEITDLNQDGNLDFLAASNTTGEVIWYQNDGNSNFSATSLATLSGGNTHSVKAGDINGDGHIDFVGIDYNENKAYWFENDGSQSFTQHELDANISGPIEIALADTDSDGDLDIMISEQSGNKIVHYENAADEAPSVVAPIADQTYDEDSGAQTLVQDVSTIFSSIFNLTYTVSSDVNEVTVSVEGDSLVVTPNPDYNGVATITLIATDDQSRTGTDEFTYTVNPVNDAPIVSNAIIDQSTNEDENLNFQFDENTFEDIDAGDNLTFSATLSDDTALPTWISFDAGTRAFSGLPTNDEVGVISIKVIATDDSNESVSDEFDLEVVNTNDAPVLVSNISNQTTNEDDVFSFQFAENTFSDIDLGDVLTYSATLTDDSVLPSWLSFDSGTRTFSGTPTNEFVGIISIMVTATDNSSASATDEFDLEIINTNDAPVVDNNIADQEINEDVLLNFQFAENTFNDVDSGDELTYSALLLDESVLPSWLSFDSETRTFSGTPTNEFVGTISIMVTATDNSSAFATDNFNLEVINTNDAPTVVNPIGTQSIDEDSEAITITTSLHTVFEDIDLGDELTYTISANITEVVPSISGNNLVVEADADFFGTAIIAVTASDLETESVTDEFTLTINPVNDAPELTLDKSDLTLVKDFVTTETVSVTFLSQPDNESDQTITYSLSPASVAFANVIIDSNTGEVSITAVPDGFGTQEFSVIADDGQSENNTGAATFLLDIIVNPPPTVDNPVSDQTFNEDELNFVIADLNSIFSDPESETLTFTASSNNNNVLVAITGSELSASAVDNYHGMALITVNATDGISTITDEFIITINAINDAPIVVNEIQNQSTLEDGVFNFTFAETTFSDIDFADGDVLSYSVTLSDENPIPGWLSFDAQNRTLSGVPTNDEVGIISIKVIANDNGGLSVSSLFDLEIINTNDAPVVSNAILDQTINEDANLNFTFAENTFEDVDNGDHLTYTVSLSNNNDIPSWLVFDENSRNFSGTPNNLDVGVLTIKVTAMDNSNEFVSDEFELEIINTNDGPSVVNAIGNQVVLEDEFFSFTFDENTFEDEDSGDLLTYSASLNDDSSLPTWLSFDGSTRTFSGTPLNEDVGSFILKVVATDNNSATTSTSFEIEVNNTNDTPEVINQIPNQETHEGANFSFQFDVNIFNDVDNGDALDYSATLVDDSNLPNWLQFNANNRTFSGSPEFEDVTTLTIKVTATDLSGANASVDFEILIVDALTGITEQNDYRKFLNVYPNPVKNILNIEFIEKIENYNLRVVDTQGKIVLQTLNSSNFNNKQLDMRRLVRGIYIVEFITKSENFRIRILKN